jgi:hypothetical protein
LAPPNRCRIGVFVLVLAGITLLSGCATQGTFRRIPAAYTALSSSPGSESYLIERIHSSADPTATRYDFTIEGNLVTAQVSTISKTGARSERRQTPEVAKRLLQVLQKFDWGSIEAPLPDDEPIAPVPDDTQIVLKARTAKSYREAHAKLADCASLRKLLMSLDAIK